MARKVILACAGMSLLAHAMAVTLWSSSDHLAATSPTTAHPSWQVRSVRAEKHAGVSPAAFASASAQSLTADRPDTETPAQPSGDGETTRPAPITDADAQQTAAVDHSIGTKEAAPQTVAHPASNWSGYIPRPELSVPPLAQAPVFIAPPAGDFEAQRISGVLSLYINEYGAVDHISSEGSDLPPAFEEAATTAFRHVTFTPGQLDGHAVKSRIKVEVVFDNTPLSNTPDEAPSR